MPSARERREIRAIVRGLDRFSERAIVKITLDLTANLIETTPVDVGWARANWVPSIGSPVVKDLSEAERNVQSAAAEQSAGTASVLGYLLRRGRVFISNNVEYILALNDGHSAQAPPGFVQRAIRKAVTVDIRGFRG